jgi:hypothetical protein
MLQLLSLMTLRLDKEQRSILTFRLPKFRPKQQQGAGQEQRLAKWKMMAHTSERTSNHPEEDHHHGPIYHGDHNLQSGVCPCGYEVVANKECGTQDSAFGGDRHRVGSGLGVVRVPF